MDKKSKLSKIALSYLENCFNKEPSPTSFRISKIAQSVQCDFKTIQIWFQNKRAKRRREEKTTPLLNFSDVSYKFSSDGFIKNQGHSLLKTRINKNRQFVNAEFEDLGEDDSDKVTDID